jgi:hypothetical protein
MARRSNKSIAELLAPSQTSFKKDDELLERKISIAIDTKYAQKLQ